MRSTCSISSLLLLAAVAALTACVDEAPPADGPAPAGYVAMTPAEVAAAAVDDGTGAKAPLALAPDQRAYLALDQDVATEAPDVGAAAFAPCGRTSTTWLSTWVVHHVQICQRGGGGCTLVPVYLRERVVCDMFCTGDYRCRAYHTDGSSHATTTPTVDASSYCELPCNSQSECEGCVVLD